MMSALMELKLHIFVLPGDVMFGTCTVTFTCKYAGAALILSY